MDVIDSLAEPHALTFPLFRFLFLFLSVICSVDVRISDILSFFFNVSGKLVR